MKKIVLLSYMLLLTLSLTACISAKEREKGDETVRNGKKYIKEYVRETYGKKARVTDLKPYYIRTYSTAVPSLNKVATGYVQATVTIGDKEFDILYNIYFDEVLTKENIDVLEDSFNSYADSKLQTVHFNSCHINISYFNQLDQCISGFLKPDITTYEELLSGGKYSIDLTYRTINSDFLSVTEEDWKELMHPFTNLKTDCFFEFLFVNYKDEEGFNEETDENYFLDINYDSFKNYRSFIYSKYESTTQYTKNIIYSNSSGDIKELKSKPQSTQ